MKYCYYCMNQMEDEAEICPHCQKSALAEVSAHHLLPGTLLHGKFCVGAALGEGGFGITYIGRDVLLDIKVAIKEYFPNGYVSRSNTVSSVITGSTTEQRKEFFDRGREKFLKEAQILAKFSGEAGVVDVRDFFEENNTAYIVMEFLDGETLKKHLRREGKMDPEETKQLLLPVMQSLIKIHESGLIHRDISPDNIMLLDDGKVKLLDFGAARNVTGDANKSLSVMLKPGYAPEEQYRSKGNQGPWTDVYALAATIYKCITGVTPDDSTQRVFSDEVKKPSELGVSISPTYENALMKGLAVLQKDRWQNVAQFLDALNGKVTASAAAEDDDDEKTVAGINLGIPASPAAPQQPQPQVVYRPQPQQAQPQPQPMNAQPQAQRQAQPQPQQPAYRPAPQQGYQRAPQGYAPAPQGYAPAPQGYAPAPQGYAPAPQGYAPAPAQTAVAAPVKKKKSKKGLFIGIGIAAAAIITVIILAASGVFSSSDKVLDPDDADYEEMIIGSWEGSIDYASVLGEQLEGMDSAIVKWVWAFDDDGSFTATFNEKDMKKLLKQSMLQSAGMTEEEMDALAREDLGMSLDEYIDDIYKENKSNFSFSGKFKIKNGDELVLSGLYGSNVESIYRIEMSKTTLEVTEVIENDEDIKDMLPLKFRKVD